MDAELPLGPAKPRASGSVARMIGNALDRAGSEGVLALLVGMYAAMVAAFGRQIVAVDSWLSLAAGRLIVSRGLPSHDTWTVFAHGRRWVDQQWLAQIAIYGLEHTGGFRLAVLTQILLLAGSLTAAIVIARLRGASARSVAIVTAVALLPLLLSSLQLRPQSFAYPLFLAVLVIVTGRQPLTLRKLAFSLVLLCLWANLHGSVVLGAGFLSLRGVVDLLDDARVRRLPRLVPLGAFVLPWPCLLVTPFPLGIPHYYARTVFNPTFGHYLAQWQPSTLSIVSLPLFVLAFGFFWLLARSSAGFNRYEKLVGLVLVAFALLAVRNWVWLGLGAVAVFPAVFDRANASGRKPLPAALNQACAIVTGLFLVIVGIIAAHPQSWFTNTYPAAAARTVARLSAANPSERIFASARWGDWLLWKEPQLEGRIAYDARAELYTTDQIKTIALFRVTPALLPEIRRRYRIFLVDRTDEPELFATLRRQGKVAYDNGEVLVVSFPPGHA